MVYREQGGGREMMIEAIRTSSPEDAIKTAREIGVPINFFGHKIIIGQNNVTKAQENIRIIEKDEYPLPEEQDQLLKFVCKESKSLRDYIEVMKSPAKNPREKSKTLGEKVEVFLNKKHANEQKNLEQAKKMIDELDDIDETLEKQLYEKYILGEVISIDDLQRMIFEAIDKIQKISRAFDTFKKQFS